MPDSTLPIPTRRCTACGVSSGGWDTLIDVTREDCEYEGGLSSVPEGSDPNTVGPCGQALNGTCDSYYAFPSLNNTIPIEMMTPWEPFSGQDNVYGDAFYDECNISRIGTVGNPANGEISGKIYYRYTDEIVLNYFDPANLPQQCAAFGALHNISTCYETINIYPPIVIDEDTTITESHSATLDNSGSWWDYVPGVSLGIGVISGATAGGISFYDWFNGNPPDDQPPSGGIGGPVYGPSAQVAAGLAIDVVKGAGAVAAGATVAAVVTGFIYGAAAGSPGGPPGAVLGGVIAVVLVVIYNTDGTTTSVTVEVSVPDGGA